MSPDPTQREEPSGNAKPSRFRIGRLLTFGVIGAFLLGLLIAPQWIALGFLSVPMIGAPEPDDSAGAERFLPVSWSVLASFEYDYTMPSPVEDASPAALRARADALFPAQVRALDGRPVAIRGYVIPIAFEAGRVTEFVLAAKNEIGCCFGDGLSMNQWVQVAVPPHVPFDLEPMAVATVTGRLEVGEEVLGGVVLSLYRLRDAAIRPG